MSDTPPDRTQHQKSGAFWTGVAVSSAFSLVALEVTTMTASLDFVFTLMTWVTAISVAAGTFMSLASYYAANPGSDDSFYKVIEDEIGTPGRPRNESGRKAEEPRSEPQE